MSKNIPKQQLVIKVKLSDITNITFATEHKNFSDIR